MEYGTEIDIRAYGSELILSHEPFQSGENFNAYLDEYKNGTLVLNIKFQLASSEENRQKHETKLAKTKKSSLSLMGSV